MNSKLALYLLALIMFILFQDSRGIYKSPSFQVDGPRLSKAYVLGDKSELSRKLREAHQKLNLAHLFTPSGLHFQATLSLIYFFFLPLFWKKKAKLKLLLLVVGILPLFWEGYLAIKRIIFLRLTFTFKKFIPFNLDHFQLFLIVFFLDVLFGTFSQSPWSYFYSFLFLGTLFSAKSMSSIPLLFFITQLFLSGLSGAPFYPLASILGIILSSLFFILFPFFILSFWVPMNLFLASYEKLILFLSKIGTLEVFYPSKMVVFLILINASSFKIKKIFLFLLLLESSPVFNLPHNDFQKKKPFDIDFLYPKSEIKKMKRVRKGYKLTYKDQSHCRHKLYNSFYEVRCQY